MRVVRNIVDTGRTIACTIHQPAIDIFEVIPTWTLQAPSAEPAQWRNGNHVATTCSLEVFT